MTDRASAEGLRAAAGDVRKRHAPDEYDWCVVCRVQWPCEAELLAELVMTREALRDTGPRPDSGCHYDPADFDRCTTHGGRIDRARAECDARLSTPRTETSEP